MHKSSVSFEHMKKFAGLDSKVVVECDDFLQVKVKTMDEVGSVNTLTRVGSGDCFGLTA